MVCQIVQINTSVGASSRSKKQAYTADCMPDIWYSMEDTLSLLMDMNEWHVTCKCPFATRYPSKGE